MLIKFLKKHREIIMYLVFGVLTTAVGMGSYFLILFASRLLGVSEESNMYNGVRAFAQIAQWVLAVLFAYFTNKKFVFMADGKKSEAKMLTQFFTSRLFSLGCDTVVTFLVIFTLKSVGYKTIALDLALFTLPLTVDLWAKCAASAVVIVVNYFLSKFVVFKKSEKQ